jgi:60 kDa SS-A/Ro ribonucleoprotein
MSKAYRNVGTRNRVTPQNEAASPKQSKNNAGGFSFTLDEFGRLERFLVLGSDAPTYYASSRELTVANASAVQKAIDSDGIRAVDMIVDVSTNGRAYRNDAALFALAMASAAQDDKTRAYALAALPKVARIGTHLFHYAEFVEQFRGWGRALKRAVANWYTEVDANKVAYQAVKYRQRDGWTHRDLLRLSHPKTPEAERRVIFDWICGRPVDTETLPPIIKAYEEAKTASVKELPGLIREANLPREALPTEALNDPKVWEALFEKMPMTAMIKNLGNMSSEKINLFKPMSKFEQEAVRRLTDQKTLHDSMIHPFAVLLALTTYKSGRGFRGSNTWKVNGNIVSALEDAFKLSFKNVVPTGKRHLLALDVSGSMTFSNIMNSNITPRDASAAMALITMKTEPVTHTVGFTSGSRYSSYRGSNAVTPLDFGRASTLDGVIRKISNLPFGGTDCAAPMLYAMENKIEADAFVIYTDNETWAGNIHPHEALRDYRRKMGIDAKLIVVGMTSTGFTIANPDDPGMLDVVGFDSNAPNVMADFVR